MSSFFFHINRQLFLRGNIYIVIYQLWLPRNTIRYLIYLTTTTIEKIQPRWVQEHTIHTPVGITTRRMMSSYQHYHRIHSTRYLTLSPCFIQTEHIPKHQPLHQLYRDMNHSKRKQQRIQRNFMKTSQPNFSPSYWLATITVSRVNSNHHKLKLSCY